MKKIRIIEKILIILGVLALGIINTILVINNKPTIKYENNTKISTKNNTNKETKKEQIDTETNNNQTNNSTTENTITSSNLNLDELSTSLHNSIQSENKKAYIVNCISVQQNTDGSPNAIEANVEVSEESIDTIINKLKEATLVESNITASWFGCPPKSISYYISSSNGNTNSIHQNRILSLEYANDETILLVGYNNIGYAYHYNNKEEINNFIESLN